MDLEMEIMESMECCVPPGFRFHPTDEELVGYYLKKKVDSQKIDLDVIRDIDLYRIEPWDLRERCRIGYEEQTEWYFFSHKDKKYPTGTRTNRATMAGFWKATGRDKAVHDKNKLIGMRKTLVFYKGRAPNGQKTDWIMHEYRLESEENAPPQEEGWVVCRAFKKRATSQQPRMLPTITTTDVLDPWGDADSASFDVVEPGSRSSITANLPIDYPLDYLYRHPHPHPPSLKSIYCKQEIAELEAFNLLNSGNNSNNIAAFMIQQLPQLESPSQLTPPAASLSAANDGDVGERARVTDWRALDKFVASQLSHDDRDGSSGTDHDHHQLEPVTELGADHGSDSADILGLLGSEVLLSSEGTCVFDK